MCSTRSALEFSMVWLGGSKCFQGAHRATGAVRRHISSGFVGPKCKAKDGLLKRQERLRMDRPVAVRTCLFQACKWHLIPSCLMQLACGSCIITNQGADEKLPCPLLVPTPRNDLESAIPSFLVPGQQSKCRYFHRRRAHHDRCSAERCAAALACEPAAAAHGPAGDSQSSLGLGMISTAAAAWPCSGDVGRAVQETAAAAIDHGSHGSLQSSIIQEARGLAAGCTRPSHQGMPWQHRVSVKMQLERGSVLRKMLVVSVGETGSLVAQHFRACSCTGCRS